YYNVLNTLESLTLVAISAFLVTTILTVYRSSRALARIGCDTGVQSIGSKLMVSAVTLAITLLLSLLFNVLVQVFPGPSIDWFLFTWVAPAFNVVEMVALVVISLRPRRGSGTQRQGARHRHRHRHRVAQGKVVQDIQLNSVRAPVCDMPEVYAGTAMPQAWEDAV
ncbi:hypothetical protein KIPB_014907, partial [Kipferlia bialata]